jgi:hypothetical protein
MLEKERTEVKEIITFPFPPLFSTRKHNIHVRHLGRRRYLLPNTAANLIRPELKYSSAPPLILPLKYKKLAQ